MDIDPNNADTYFHLAKLLMSQRKFNDAGLACTEAIRVNPNHVEALAMLGQVCDMQGRARESFQYLRRALRVDPNQASLMSHLAVRLATVKDESLRNPAEAIQLSQRATQLEPSNPDTWNALAVAYAASANFEDAIRAGEKALELCRASGQDAAAAQIAESLVRYRNEQP